MNKTFVYGGSLIALTPVLIHQTEVIQHPEESNTPDCIVRANACAYDDGPEPEAPAPVGQFWTHMLTTTSSTATTMPSDAFGRLIGK